jgi:hypothetical protein
MNYLEWYNKLARHCEETKMLGTIEYRQIELLAEFVANEEAAQQSVHPTAAGVSASGDNSESGGG